MNHGSAAAAADIAAAQGVPPVAEEIPDAPASKSADQLWAEYAQLKDPREQRAFYLANKDRM